MSSLPKGASDADRQRMARFNSVFYGKGTMGDLEGANRYADTGQPPAAGGNSQASAGAYSAYRPGQAQSQQSPYASSVSYGTPPAAQRNNSIRPPSTPKQGGFQAYAPQQGANAFGQPALNDDWIAQENNRRNAEYENSPERRRQRESGFIVADGGPSQVYRGEDGRLYDHHPMLPREWSGDRYLYRGPQPSATPPPVGPASPERPASPAQQGAYQTPTTRGQWSFTPGSSPFGQPRQAPTSQADGNWANFATQNRPPAFTARYGNYRGGFSDTPATGMRDAFVQSINDQTGRGQFGFDANSAWQNAQQMNQSGWRNPFATRIEDMLQRLRRASG